MMLHHDVVLTEQHGPTQLLAHPLSWKIQDRTIERLQLFKARRSRGTEMFDVQRVYSASLWDDWPPEVSCYRYRSIMFFFMCGANGNPGTLQCFEVVRSHVASESQPTQNARNTHRLCFGTLFYDQHATVTGPNKRGFSQVSGFRSR